ncbi:MAG TPA: hypothetical protein VLG76_01960 [Rhabdochlamydiaceae bacterium]|nr:hypothetical protein [Rhabdochlamydiaceae bacterium]
MSSLTRVEDSLSPVASLYKNYISTILQKRLSEIEPSDARKGDVSLTVSYKPFQQTSLQLRENFFRATICDNTSWENSPRNFSFSRYLQDSLVDTLRRLGNAAEGFIHKAPIATIEATFLIRITLFNETCPKLKDVYSLRGHLRENAYQNAFIGISPSTKPLENSERFEAPKEDDNKGFTIVYTPFEDDSSTKKIIRSKL